MVLETLTGICPSCGKRATFRYIGEQYGHENGPLQLYNCGECDSTVSGRRIIIEGAMVSYLRENGWTVSKR